MCDIEPEKEGQDNFDVKKDGGYGNIPLPHEKYQFTLVEGRSKKIISIVTMFLMLFTVLAAWQSAYWSSRSVEITRKESFLRTRPYLTGTFKPTSSGSGFFIRNYGQIPAIKVKVRKKYRLSWKGDEKEYEKWIRSSYGSSENYICPGEEANFGDTLFSREEVINLIPKGVRIEGYFRIEYMSYDATLLFQHGCAYYIEPTVIEFHPLRKGINEIPLQLLCNSPLEYCPFKEKFKQDVTAPLKLYHLQV